MSGSSIAAWRSFVARTCRLTRRYALPFLNGLCNANPDLHVYILAWDFHVVLALERQLMQQVYFRWMTNPRFRFLLDDCPVPGGSHHQKFVVVDGTRTRGTAPMRQARAGSIVPAVSSVAPRMSPTTP
jgi:hypothetical protein